MSGNPDRSQPSRWMQCRSCIIDCCTCCTSREGWKKCLSCNLDCCTSQDENAALLGADNRRQGTTPQSTAISQQPTPWGNNVRSEDRTTQKMDNSPEPPQTMSETNEEDREKTPQRTKSNQVQPEESAETNEEDREKTPQRTKSNQVQPEESAGELSYGKSNLFEDKLEQMRGVIRKSSKKNVKVGIFSRSAESEYEWLTTRLKAESFVKSVQPCCITNNGSDEFLSNVSRCDFGILYHTKNRGRVNLTDVTDSLYNEELQILSSRLGKKNVVVVIDDLTDSGEERKTEILKDQPKLGSLAADVFLFSGEEKK